MARRVPMTPRMGRFLLCVRGGGVRNNEDINSGASFGGLGRRLLGLRIHNLGRDAQGVTGVKPILSQVRPRIIPSRGLEGRAALHKRRRWFAEEDDADDRDDKGGDGQQGGKKYDPADMDEANTIIRSLVKRLDERDAEKQQFQTQIDELKGRLDTKDKAQKQQLEEDGKYKDLYEQALAEIETLKPYKDQAERYRKVVERGNEKLISQIPEDRRAVVPKSLTPDELHDWLGTSLPMLTLKPAPDMDAGAGANGGSGRDQTPKLAPEDAAVAAQMGLSAEDIDEANKALGASQ